MPVRVKPIKPTDHSDITLGKYHQHNFRELKRTYAEAFYGDISTLLGFSKGGFIWDIILLVIAYALFAGPYKADKLRARRGFPFPGQLYYMYYMYYIYYIYYIYHMYYMYYMYYMR